MKKSAIIIVWGVILCTSVFIVVHMLYYTKVQIETPTLIHKSFEGTISFYCDESDSPYTHIVIALANRPDKTERFVVTEDTIFADDSESIIAERIVGVHVEIESEYWNNVEYDYYPVTLISAGVKGNGGVEVVDQGIRLLLEPSGPQFHSIAPFASRSFAVRRRKKISDRVSAQSFPCSRRAWTLSGRPHRLIKPWESVWS